MASPPQPLLVRPAREIIFRIPTLPRRRSLRPKGAFPLIKNLRTRFLELTAGRPLGRAVSILAGGTAASQALALCAMPVLTRLYPVEVFGILQVYLSLLTACLAIASLRYELAILLPQDDEVAANVHAVALVSVFLVSAAVAVGVALLPLQRWRGISGEVTHWLWLLPAGVLAGGSLQVATYWALRDKLFAAVARAKFTQVGGQIGVQLPLGAVAPSPVSLIGGDIIGRTLAAVVLFRSSLKRSAGRLRAVSLQGMRAAAWRYREFPMVSSGSGLLNAAGGALPPLLIGYLYGAKVLGLFALVDRVMSAPSTLVGQAISQVYMSEGGRVAAVAPEKLYALFKRMLLRLLQLAIGPAILVAIFAPTVFGFVFGPQWAEAGYFARLLAPRHLLAFAVWPLSSTLALIERQRTQLAWDLGRLVMALGAVWLAFHEGLSAAGAIGFYSVAVFLNYCAYITLCYVELMRRTHRTPVQQLSAMK
jgi:O-antigen/teichoic acid export membrane protein